MVLLEPVLHSDKDGNLRLFDGLKESTMAKGKQNRELIRLVSSAGTGYFYTTSKKRGREKLNLKKYDPKIKQHVIFKEAKIK